MDIDQMHSTFRVIGQQMGMQLVRGVLPESIDVYINAEIGEVVQTELLANAHTVLQDNVNLQSMTMSPINLFRTLYRKDEIPVRYEFNYYSSSQGPSVENGIKDYVNIISEVGYYKIYIPNVYNVGSKELNYPVADANINNTDEQLTNAKYWCKIIDINGMSQLVKRNTINPMLYLGVNIAKKGVKPGQFTACRLIGANVLETTLRDYCNGADKNYPIAVLLGESLDVYEDEELTISKTINAEYFEIYTNTANFEIDKIYLSYIKYPNIVHWDIDSNKRVNCDLPEYIHYRIVEGAVRRFLNSINNGSVSQNQQKQ